MQLTAGGPSAWMLSDGNYPHCKRVTSQVIKEGEIGTICCKHWGNENKFIQNFSPRTGSEETTWETEP